MMDCRDLNLFVPEPKGNAMQESEKQRSRSFVRITNEMVVQYKPLPPSTKAARTSSQAKTKNMSVAGICFYSPEKRSVGEQLVVELHIPSYATPITPIARVVWCHPGNDGYDTGLELMWLDWQADEQLIFANYIHNLHRRKRDENVDRQEKENVP